MSPGKRGQAARPGEHDRGNAVRQGSREGEAPKSKAPDRQHWRRPCCRWIYSSGKGCRPGSGGWETPRSERPGGKARQGRAGRKSLKGRAGKASGAKPPLVPKISPGFQRGYRRAFKKGFFKASESAAGRDRLIRGRKRDRMAGIATEGPKARPDGRDMPECQAPTFEPAQNPRQTCPESEVAWKQIRNGRKSNSETDGAGGGPSVRFG